MKKGTFKNAFIGLSVFMVMGLLQGWQGRAHVQEIKIGVIELASGSHADLRGEERKGMVLFRVPTDMATMFRGIGPWIVDTLGKKWYFFTHDYTRRWSGTNWVGKY